VSLWARDPALAAELAGARTNSRRLPGVRLDPRVRVEAELAPTVADAAVVLVAVPTGGVRAVIEAVAPALPAGVPVVSLAKGFEPGTRLRMSEVVADAAPGHPCGALTGPNLAREILDGHAAASVLAIEDDAVGEHLQELLSTEWFRVYRNTDLVGCELAGALKNVVAIAAGMAEGLGTGDNTRAAVITRGLAELSRLGAAMGGNPLTFSGLAGLGDVVATCASPLSRNRRVGELLGRGRPLDEVLAPAGGVAEGITAAPIAVELAAEHGVEVPIAAQVADVLAGRTTAAEAYRGLLGRRRRAELYGLG
jgi:glycerol-3-phosphate dehydrogenase (NAD(P)+)